MVLFNHRNISPVAQWSEARKSPDSGITGWIISHTRNDGDVHKSESFQYISYTQDLANTWLTHTWFTRDNPQDQQDNPKSTYIQRMLQNSVRFTMCKPPLPLCHIYPKSLLDQEQDYSWLNVIKDLSIWVGWNVNWHWIWYFTILYKHYLIAGKDWETSMNDVKF